MKLALVRSLDAGDPLTQLGRPRRIYKKAVPTPAAWVEVSPSIWRGPDGKLETRIEGNEAAKWSDAPMRKVGMNPLLGMKYTGTVTGRVSSKVNPHGDLNDEFEAAYERVIAGGYLIHEQFVQKYLCDPAKLEPPVVQLTEHEQWLDRGKKPRQLAIGETVEIEDVQDGYITVVGAFCRDYSANTIKRLA